MKNWYLVNPNNIPFGMFSLLVVLISLTFYIQNIEVLRFVLFLAVPLFAIFYFFKIKSLSVPALCFLLSSFLANSLSLFFVENSPLYIINVLCLVAILSLVFIVYKEFIEYQLSKWLMIYLWAMFAISLCFLFEITRVFSGLIVKNTEVYVFFLQGLGLIVLGLLALGMCLVDEQKGKSPIFLFMAVLCFAFSLSISYIANYYVYNWFFEPLDKLFYVSGLYLMIKYALSEGKPQKPIEEYEVLYSEVVAP